MLEIKQLEGGLGRPDLNLQAKGTFGLGDSRRSTNGMVSARADLGKLHALVARLSQDAPTARGIINAELSLKSDNRGNLAIKGQAGGRDLLIQDARQGLSWEEKAFNLKYDLTTSQDQNRVDIKEVSLQSTPVGITVSGLMREVEVGRSSLELQIKGDHLDLDAVAALGGGAKKAEAAPAPAPDGAKGKDPGAPAPDPAADLRAGLKGLSALMTMDIAKITYQGLQVTDLKGEVRILDGVIKLPHLTGKPLGGYMQLVGSLDSNPEQPSASLNLLTEGLQMDKATMARARKALPVFNLPVASIEGEVNVAGNFAFKGLTPEGIQKSLDGQGTLLAPKGVTLGLGVLDSLPLVKGLPRLF